MKALIYVLIGIGVYCGESACGKVEESDSWAGTGDFALCVAIWPALLAGEITAACIATNEGQINATMSDRANEKAVGK